MLKILSILKKKNSNTHLKIQLNLEFIEILLCMRGCYISSLPNSDSIDFIRVFIENGVFSLALHVIRGKTSKLKKKKKKIGSSYT